MLLQKRRLEESRIAIQAQKQEALRTQNPSPSPPVVQLLILFLLELISGLVKLISRMLEIGKQPYAVMRMKFCSSYSYNLKFQLIVIHGNSYQCLPGKGGFPVCRC